MPTPVLVERLKRAKEELTALKTAHKRGVGMLKVFEENIAPQAPDQTPWNLTITLTFGADTAPYPFVYAVAKTLDETSYVFAAGFTQENIEYANEHTVKVAGEFWASNPVPTRILSTAPVESVSYSWSKDS